jgi:MoaA/NifB/PqqE/SkfB family radical SAM enzyme
MKGFCVMPSENIFSSGALKLLYYSQKINQWEENRAIIPITLEIQPSERCNHNCPNCQAQFCLKKKETRERAKSGIFLNLSLLDSIWDFPPEGIVISGNSGDPLTHPHIYELIQTITIKSIPFVLITNGGNLTKRITDLLVKGSSGVRISLDACDAKSFSLTHGVNSNEWERVLYNISNLVNNRKSSPDSKCMIGLGFLTSKQSSDWMFKATKLAKTLGVDYIQFRPYHYDVTEINQQLTECKKLENDSFKVFSSDQKYSRLGDCSRGIGCQAAWFYSVLDARGDLYICCHNVGNKDASIGSLADDNWKNILESTKRKSVINDFSKVNCIPNCRLHTQNLLLEKIWNQQIIPSPEINDIQIKNHAPFL